MRFLVHRPLGVTMQAWTLLSIFVATIAGTPGRTAWRRGLPQGLIEQPRLHPSCTHAAKLSELLLLRISCICRPFLQH